MPQRRECASRNYIRSGPELSRRTPERSGEDMAGNVLAHFAGSLEAILEAAGAGRVVEACNRLSAALEAAAVPPAAELPGSRARRHLSHAKRWPAFNN
jgi:hypothetical protein